MDRTAIHKTTEWSRASESACPPSHRVSLIALGLTVAILSACGSPATVEDYLDDLSGITEQMTREAFAALPPGASPTHEQVAEVVDARRRALASIERLSPPSALEPEHRVLIVAFGRFVDAGAAFLEDTAGLDPQAFAERLQASIEIDALADRVSDACDAVRRRAQELEHQVGLAC